MSIQTPHALFDSTTIEQISEHVIETPRLLLAEETEELGALRFSIILTARWADSDSESPDRRAELRYDLALLRKRYSNKIDEIAMTFGVDQAMRAQREVERTVVVPRDPVTMRAPCDYKEDDDSEYNV